MKLLTILLMFFTFSALAREYDDEMISSTLIEGAHLYFDCQAQHWVCSSERSLERCERMRREAQYFDDKLWPCVAFKKYENTITCHQKIKTILESQVPKDFCYRRSFRHDLTKL